MNTIRIVKPTDSKTNSPFSAKHSITQKTKKIIIDNKIKKI